MTEEGKRAEKHAKKFKECVGSVKDVIHSACKRVGRQRYGKNGETTYTAWKWNAIDNGLDYMNCWTSVLFWMWHGKAVNNGWMQRYCLRYTNAAVKIMTDKSEKKLFPEVTLVEQDLTRAILMGQNRSDVAATVRSADDDVIAPAGRAVFFKGRHTGPLAHVALTIGGGLCVSNWMLPKDASRPHANQMLHDGLVHVEKIGVLAYLVDPECEVRVTPKPLWKMTEING